MPREERVAEIFWPMRPDLPRPETRTVPLDSAQRTRRSTAAWNSGPRVEAKLVTAAASAWRSLAANARSWAVRPGAFGGWEGVIGVDLDLEGAGRCGIGNRVCWDGEARAFCPWFHWGKDKDTGRMPVPRK